MRASFACHGAGNCWSSALTECPQALRLSRRNRAFTAFSALCWAANDAHSYSPSSKECWACSRSRLACRNQSSYRAGIVSLLSNVRVYGFHCSSHSKNRQGIRWTTCFPRFGHNPAPPRPPAWRPGRPAVREPARPCAPLSEDLSGFGNLTGLCISLPRAAPDGRGPARWRRGASVAADHAAAARSSIRRRGCRPCRAPAARSVPASCRRTG